MADRRAAEDVIDFDPFTISRAKAFGHNKMNVGFESRITPKGVSGVDQADAYIRVEVSNQFTDGLSGCWEENL